MSNEYDYSGMYNNNPSAAQPGAAPQQSAPEQSSSQYNENASAGSAAQQPGGYPNVGSSGLNTANTAEPQHGAYNAAQNTANTQNVQYGANQPNQTPNAAQNGYTSSFGGNGGAGGYNGYSYTSAPQQPPRKEKKKGSGKKVLLRVVACVGVAAIGFGSGVAGTVYASRSGLIGGQVVVQTVERSTADSAAISQGSTNGESLSLQDVSAIVQPSVVAITTEQMTTSNTWFGGSYVQSGAGSGVIISEDGYILTCAHVVSGATNIKVQLADESEYTASIIGGDSAADIAVIKIDAAGLTPAVIGDSDALAVGEDAIAVGNPLGTLGGTVTNGIISAVNRSVKVQTTSDGSASNMNLIQTNASISPGNSGGGLFNGNGELIGIVNAKSGYSEAEGLGFAIPINTAMDVAQSLISDGYVKRPVLGVTVITINDAQTAQQYGVTAYGVYIASINGGSGAEKAGLKMGDRIVAAGDTAISQSSDLTGYLQGLNIGDTVTLQVEREGKLASYEVVLGESTQS